MPSIRSRLRNIDLRDTAARLRRVGREFFWVVTGQALAAAGAVVGVRLMTHALEPRAYGELALGMATAVLVQQAILAPLSGGGLRFFAAAEESRSLRKFLSAMRALLWKATLLILIVAVAIFAAIGAAAGTRWLPLSIAAFVFALLVGYAVILDGFQNAARQRVVVAFHDALSQWARFLIAFALTMLIAHTSTMALIGYALGAGMVLLSQAIFFRVRLLNRIANDDRASPITQSDWQTRIRTYAWPIGTWGVFSWAQAASDRWALEVARSTSEVGLYAVVYQLGYYPITILSGLVIQLVSPIVFARAGDASEAARLRTSRRFNHGVLAAVGALTVAGVCVAAGLHRLIFSIFAAPAYRPFSGYLPWLILSGGVFAAGQVGSLSIMAGGKTQRLLTPRIVTAVAGVALNFVWAFRFGVDGVIAAGVIVNAAFLVWVMVLVAVDRQPIAEVARPSEGAS